MNEESLPAHLERTGIVTVRAPLREAFGFFTPAGERKWVPGWSPEYLYTLDGVDREGTVFRTGVGGEETVWLIARFDPEAGRAQYVRVTPGSRIATVSIECTAAGERTAVAVTYRVTALSPEGNRAVESFAAQFDDMLQRWEAAVARLTSPSKDGARD